MNLWKKIVGRDNTTYPISDSTRDIIDQMLAHGFKEGQEYVVEFAFFGERINLEKLRVHMLEREYTEDTEQSEEMLILLKKVPLSYLAIGQAIAEMNGIAHEYRVGFDGWSCAIS